MTHILLCAGRGAVNSRRWRVLLIALLLAVAGSGSLGGTAARAESGVSKEGQVKAAFLFNFVQFVDWPAAAFPGPATPISIGILGDDPFGSYLEEIVRGETVKNRALVIRRSRELDELKTCHVLFIGKSESARVAAALAALGEASVLTVGDADGFCAAGGVISFFLQGNNVRFEVNMAAAQRKGLKMSAQLLRVSKIVPTDTH